MILLQYNGEYVYMKVLYLTNLPSPYKVNFFNELGKLCDLTVVFERRKASDRNDKWYENYNSKSYKELMLNGKEIGNDNSISFGLKNHLKKNNYDKIIIGGYNTYTAMITIQYLKDKNIPFILSTDGGFIKKDHFFQKLIKKHFISSATSWLSTGRCATDYLVHYGAKKDKCLVYPFTSLMEKDILKHPLSVKEKKLYKQKLNISEEYVILSVGQFIYRKGYDILLHAMKDLTKSAALYIVGGLPNDEYKKICEEDHLEHVHFVDFKTKDELMEYYKAADLFVLPTREDIWGLVINEAMAFSLPVITTCKCNAGIELIDANCGIIINDIENPKSYSDSINDILNGKYNFNDESILSKIRKYTIEEMARVIYNYLCI